MDRNIACRIQVGLVTIQALGLLAFLIAVALTPAALAYWKRILLGTPKRAGDRSHQAHDRVSDFISAVGSIEHLD